jgi:hypothetical protein
MERHYGYMLRGQITGLYKIGITNNIKRRMSSYQTHMPERILQEAVKVFNSKEEAQDWERLILDSYASSIHHGEWLDIDFDDAVTIWGDGMASSFPHDFNGCHYLVKQVASMFCTSYRIRVFKCDSRQVALDLSEALEGGQWWSLFTDLPREITDEILADGISKAEERMAMIAMQSEEIRCRMRALKAAGVARPEGWDAMNRVEQLGWLDSNHPMEASQ